MFINVNQARGLAVGAKVENFSAQDIHGNKLSLIEVLKHKPVVLIFIRGQWCPFCNEHLRQLQKDLSRIYEKGANVIVVSPEKSEFIKSTIKKTGAEFTILYDEDYKISDLFDVTFKPNKMLRIFYDVFLGSKLKTSHSDDSERLPVPATFIIDKSQNIVWRHFNHNYMRRANISDVIANIPE